MITLTIIYLYRRYVLQPRKKRKLAFEAINATAGV